jgi:anti-sigma factor RsiW
MDNPCQYASLLSAFMDGELSTAQAEAVRRHLESCGGCRRQLADLQATDRALKEMEQLEPSAGFEGAFWDKVAGPKVSGPFHWWERYLRPAWRPALAAALACGVIAGGWIFSATGGRVSPEDRFMADNVEFLINYDLIDNLDILENWEAIDAIKERT